jgi:hypothetical protein
MIPWLLNGRIPLTITGFVVLDDQLFAVTSFLGTILNTSGQASQGLIEGILRPVKIRKATTRTLKLEFEPIPLELLGVSAVQSGVTLELNTRSGPGILHRDLLWAIAHLLENSSATAQGLAELLNSLLIPRPSPLHQD